ncbi:MAG TPA: hypothetical protein PLX97_16775, partial [Gemmatales bacterium]|nr:hypothetical protein [Gemmatales bacterium]
MELFKKKFTTWKLNGKRVPAGTVGAEKVVIESTKYYAKLNGKQIPLSADKDVARKKLRKLAGDAELRGVGLVDPFEPHRNKPLEDHLKDYDAILNGKGST